MSRLLLAIPFMIIAAYLVVSIRMLPVLFTGDVRPIVRLRTIVSLGPGEFLRRTWRALLTTVIGVFALSVGISGYSTYAAYQAAPPCGSNQAWDCRSLQDLVVARVERQSSRSGAETVVYFTSLYGPATFWSDDVSPEAITAGNGVNAEVWRGRVTALTINGARHQSFAVQSDAWGLIVFGLGLLLLGITWLVIDLALESMEPQVETLGNIFVAPVKRRRVLQVLLPLFGLSLIVFGFAYVAIALGAFGAANTLAAIYLIGAVLILPVMIPVFVAWFTRAYINVRALRLGTKHSAWFVAAALVVPPLSLYMPYRLAREMVENTGAELPPRVLANWWACAIGWLGLTIVGLSFGSSDPRDSSLPNQVSNAMLFGSALVGLYGVWLTIRLIETIDGRESAIAVGHPA